MVSLHLQLEQLISGHMSTNDTDLSGHPVEVTTPEIIEKIHDMVMDDRRVKIREISKTAGVSNDSVHTILHEH